MSLALIIAVKERNLAGVKTCLAGGANINFCDEHGKTALIWASHYGFSEIVEYLLKQKADPNIRCVSDSNTALHLAISGGHLACMMSLIHLGANPDSINHHNHAPYQLAITHSNILIQIAAHAYRASQLFNQGKGSYEAFDVEFAIILKKLTSIELLTVRDYKENLNMIAFLYYFIGKLALNKDPNLAVSLFKKIPNIPGVPYFAKAYFKIYVLMKSGAIQLTTPPGVNAQSYKLYFLIQAMLYSKVAIDNDGVRLSDLILEYTQEKPENIQRMRGLSELLTLDSLELKNDFLLCLTLLYKKNHRLQTQKAELQQLKGSLSPAVSRVRTPLPTLNEDMPGFFSPAPSPKASERGVLIFNKRKKILAGYPASQKFLSPESSPTRAESDAESNLSPGQANSQPNIKLHDTPPKKTSNSQIELHEKQHPRTVRDSNPIHRTYPERIIKLENAPVRRRSDALPDTPPTTLPATPSNALPVVLPATPMNARNEDLPDAAPF